MRPRPVQTLTALLTCVVVVSAAGCGKKSSITSTSTTTTAAAAATTGASAAPTASATTPSSASAALGALASAGNCKSLRNLGVAFSQAFNGAKGDVQKEAQVLQEFAAKTPSDIRPDFETLANALTKIAAALEGYKPGATPTASTLAKLQALQGSLDQQQLQTAEQDIANWAAKNCHS
jgi:hypothetical protein